MKQPVDFIFTPLDTDIIPYYRLVLRGISQICFQSNELTGLFFLAAVLTTSPISFAYLLVAAILAPAGRMLMGERGPILTTGLPGLNPCLMALSLSSFFHTGWTNLGMWGVLIIGVISVIILVKLCVAILPFPPLALPFIIIFWLIYALEPTIDVLQLKLPQIAISSAIHPLIAVLFSLGQAIFSPNMWSGLLFLCGLLLSNWRHGIIAFVGAAIAALVSYYYRDVDPSSVNFGLYGSNGVLAAVSVYVFCGGHFRLSILGSLLATIFIPLVASFGVQTLSAPFVLTTWLMLGMGWIDNHWFKVRFVNTVSSTTAQHREMSDECTLTHSIVIDNLAEQTKKLRTTNEWKPFRQGVSAHWLYHEDHSGAAAVLLRYEPGARVMLHEHLGYEHMFVIEGDQFDENGSYPAGSFVIHPPGTKHSPGSKEGCVALLIYEKGVRFVKSETNL
ncbi:MAG: hypothetical protein Tsb0021_10180 [Chlamydiales bacterium]